MVPQSPAYLLEGVSPGPWAQDPSQCMAPLSRLPTLARGPRSSCGRDALRYTSNQSLLVPGPRSGETFRRWKSQVTCPLGLHQWVLGLEVVCDHLSGENTWTS